MQEKSYFADQENEIRKNEEMLWNFIEMKPYDSIIKKYIKAVEDKNVKHRYTAPAWQSVGIQILRIFGK